MIVTFQLQASKSASCTGMPLGNVAQATGRVAYWVHSTRSVFLLPGARRVDLRLRRLVDWLAVRRAARLVANSHFAATRLRQLYHRDPDAIVYPGVDLAQFRPGDAPGFFARLAEAPALYELAPARVDGVRLLAIFDRSTFRAAGRAPPTCSASRGKTG